MYHNIQHILGKRISQVNVSFNYASQSILILNFQNIVRIHKFLENASLVC